MADVKEVVLRLQVDSSQGQQALQNFARTAEGAALASTKTTSALGGMVKGFLALATVYKAYDFTRDALNMAAAAERSGRLFNMAFGSMAEEARKWAASVSGSLKVDRDDVEKTAASFKTLFDNVGFGGRQATEMAEGLTKLGTELEIVYGLAEGEGASRLHSGIVGMGRSLQSLNIVINDTMVQEYGLRQGWIQQGQKLSEAGEQAARFYLIMEQGKKVHDNLGEATKGYSEQLRQLKVEMKEVKQSLGEGLLPAMTTAMQDTNTWLQENEKRLKQWAETTGWAMGVGVKYLALYYDQMEKLFNLKEILRAQEDRETQIQSTAKRMYRMGGGDWMDLKIPEEDLPSYMDSYSLRRVPTNETEWRVAQEAAREYVTEQAKGKVGPRKTELDRANEALEAIRQRNQPGGEGPTEQEMAKERYRELDTRPQEVKDRLEFEYELLGKTNLEREQAIALQEAGIKATDRQVASIDAEARAIENAVKRLEDARRLRDIADGIGESFGRAFEDIALGARDASEAVRAFALEVVRSVLHKTVTEPMTDQLSSILSKSFMSWFGGFGGQSYGALDTSQFGNYEAMNAFYGYHAGGRVGMDSAAVRYAPASLLNCAPRLHSGLAPDEYPAILQYGERVQSRVEVAAQNQAPRLPTKWELHVHNQSGQPLDIQGGDIQVDQGRMTATVIINDLKSHGPIARALRRMR